MAGRSLHGNEPLLLLFAPVQSVNNLSVHLSSLVRLRPNTITVDRNRRARQKDDEGGSLHRTFMLGFRMDPPWRSKRSPSGGGTSFSSKIPLAEPQSQVDAAN